MQPRIQGQSAGAEALMRRVLRDGGAIAAEYPIVFEPRFDGRIVSIAGRDGGPVHAACAMLTRVLVTPEAEFPVGLIGSVATDPAYRGRGLATRVLRTAEATFRNEGCVVAMLWANDPGFYLRRGYLAVGTEMDFVVPRQHIPRLPAADGIREATPDDLPRVQELYERHPVRVRRSLEETGALLQGPGIELLVREEHGRVVAYSCQGRGDDLRGVVHEWSGRSQDVLALLRAHFERRAPDEDSTHLVVMAPANARRLARDLDAIDSPSARGVLGMARLVSACAAASLLRRVAGPRITVTADEQERTITVAGPRGEMTLDEEEIVLLLFAPGGDRRPVQALEAALGIDCPGLPLSPFVWGLDSI